VNPGSGFKRGHGNKLAASWKEGTITELKARDRRRVWDVVPGHLFQQGKKILKDEMGLQGKKFAEVAL
jgi:hypothetical protein